jgi:hypothetical protein
MAEKLEKGREGGGIKEDLSIMVRGSDSRGLNRSGLAPAFGGVPLLWVPEILASAHKSHHKLNPVARSLIGPSVWARAQNPSEG